MLQALETALLREDSTHRDDGKPSSLKRKADFGNGDDGTSSRNKDSTNGSAYSNSHFQSAAEHCRYLRRRLEHAAEAAAGKEGTTEEVSSNAGGSMNASFIAAAGEAPQHARALSAWHVNGLAQSLKLSESSSNGSISSSETANHKASDELLALGVTGRVRDATQLATLRAAFCPSQDGSGGSSTTTSSSSLVALGRASPRVSEALLAALFAFPTTASPKTASYPSRANSIQLPTQALPPSFVVGDDVTARTAAADVLALLAYHLANQGPASQRKEASNDSRGDIGGPSRNYRSELSAALARGSWLFASSESPLLARTTPVSTATTAEMEAAVSETCALCAKWSVVGAGALIWAASVGNIIRRSRGLSSSAADGSSTSPAPSMALCEAALAIVQATAVAWPNLRPHAVCALPSFLLCTTSSQESNASSSNNQSTGRGSNADAKKEEEEEVQQQALHLLLHLSVLGQAPAACAMVTSAASKGAIAPKLARSFAMELSALASPPYSKAVIRR